MVSPGSLGPQRRTHGAASARSRKLPGQPLGGSTWHRVLAALGLGAGVGRAQNLKRSMKCCGDTGVEQRSGSVAVQGCPESCGRRRGPTGWFPAAEHPRPSPRHESQDTRTRVLLEQKLQLTCWGTASLEP